MGVMKNSGGTALTYSSSGFTTSTLPFGSKYADQYTYGTSSSNYTGRILGDATGEVAGWHSDYSAFVSSSYTWFNRGSDGGYSGSTKCGVFTFGRATGDSTTGTSFRSVLAPIS